MSVKLKAAQEALGAVIASDKAVVSVNKWHLSIDKGKKDEIAKAIISSDRRSVVKSSVEGLTVVTGLGNEKMSSIDGVNTIHFVRKVGTHGSGNA